MFPLSTPTTSGVWADALSLAIVLAGLCLFVVGLADIWKRARLWLGVGRPAARTGGADGDGPPPLDDLTLGVYGALGLVGLAVAVMFVRGPAIPAGQVAFILIAAWGFFIAVAHAPRLLSWWRCAPPAQIGRVAAFVAAGAYSLWFWADIFRDHVALPCADDGIVHTAYYLRILEAGVPTLGRVPIGFSNLFGKQVFQFYPTGTHALMAMASGFWGQWGVISHAGILKAWFTLTMAAAPFALFWVLRRLMPRLPWWVGLSVVFMAMPGFRFPIEAAHEGGLSRLLTHVLLAPVYADVLLGRFDRWRTAPVAGALLGVAFLMHPSAFVTVAALLAWSTVAAALTERRWQSRAVRLAGLLAALGVGAAIAFGLLAWNRGEAVARDAAKPFSWPALWSRWLSGVTTFFSADYGMGPIVIVAIAAGLVLLMARRRSLGLSWRVAGFPFCILAVAVTALSAQLVHFPGSRLVGGAFYDEVPRVIELFYESAGLCIAVFAWALWRALDRASGGRAIAVSILAAALVMGAAGYQQASAAWVRAHIAHEDIRFRTARISRLQALGSWIEHSTEPGAIIFHLPFDTEIWEAWTGRRGIFMYGECHVHNDLVPCKRRKDLIRERIDVLRSRLEQPMSDERCLTEIDRFTRPGYFLVASPFSSSHAFAACRDATYVATLDGHAILTYAPGAVSHP